MNEYVEVRGPHPIYINGFTAVVFHGFDRGITVEFCRKYLKTHELVDGRVWKCTEVQEEKS